MGSDGGDGVRSSVPSTGGYYWFPTPSDRSAHWDVLTCHELGYGPDEGHFEMWPAVIDRLASAWGRDRGRLRKRLGRHCYGLPRGRVTRPGRQSLVLHGRDAPVADWIGRVIERFHLDPRWLKSLYDEHERTLGPDRRIVYAEFGLPANPAVPGIGEGPS